MWCWGLAPVGRVGPDSFVGMGRRQLWKEGLTELHSKELVNPQTWAW